MIRYCVLSSGSKGNAIWVEADGQAVLVDAGLPGRELKRRMALAGLNTAGLKAVIVTHEHRDHINGVGILARMMKLPVYINQETLSKSAPMLGRIEPRFFQTGRRFEVGGLFIHPFSTSHDAADSVGLTFERDGRRLGVATDLGTATKMVRHRLAGCQALILEFNHDLKMLLEGPYPWVLKTRIRSRQGHLSNDDAAELLTCLAHRDLAGVVLAHLSETNNHPELALEAAGAALKPWPECVVTAARQHEPLEIFEI
ncbi:MAG: MBL fold metallo-hydrolase [Pseudomonadota bacterium]